MAELFRRCDEITDEALRKLFRDAVRPIKTLRETGVTQSVSEMRKLIDAGLELMEMGERLGALADQLPPEAIDVPFEELEQAAAHNISQGIIDLARLRWASSLIDWRLGWAALAEGLRQEGADAAWAAVNLEVVLSFFRNATQPRIRAVAKSAGLDVKTCPADCTPSQLNRLVTSLLEATRS